MKKNHSENSTNYIKYIKFVALILICLSIIAVFPFSRYCALKFHENILGIEPNELEFLKNIVRPILITLVWSVIVLFTTHFYEKDNDISIIYPSVLILFFLISCVNFYRYPGFKGYATVCDFGDFVNAVEGYSSGSVLATNYPPLAVSLFKVINISLSEDVVISTYVKNFWFIMIMIFSSIGIYVMTRKLVDTRYKSITAAGFIVCGPMLFLFNRGNLLVIAFAFTLLYLVFYDSEDVLIRYTGLFALAVAANLKYYPAIFGLLLLKERKYKDAIVCGCMGISLFVIPILFEQSLNVIPSFGASANGLGIDNLFKGSTQFVDSVELGLTNSLRDSLYRVHSYVGIGDEIVDFCSYLLLALYIIVSLLCVIFTKRKSDMMLMLSVMCVVIPSISFDYAKIFMIIPFCYFISEEKKYDLLWTVKTFLYLIGLIANYKMTFMIRGYTWHIWILWFIAVVMTFMEIRKNTKIDDSILAQ